MKADDHLCLCFHVSWRKVINYVRVHRVKIPSQLAECQSAGTGCGWCRKAMVKLIESMDNQPPDAEEIDTWLLETFKTSKAAYADGRKAHIKSKEED